MFSTRTTSAMRLTPLAKTFITATVLGVVTYAAHVHDPTLFARLVPARAIRPAVVPPDVTLAGTATRSAAVLGQTPGCPLEQEMRMELWAWNAQMGLMLANGGVRSTKDSPMCRHGVNLRFIRQDDPAKMREDLAVFASRLAAGDADPKSGTALVAIMGDGSATFLAELDRTLAKLGPEYTAKVVGSSGFSYGEDKLMGPPEWKKDPELARGSLVAGVLRDGDWNIAQAWLGQNRICNNPDERTFDPECMNWLSTPGYVEAAQAYVAGVCEERPVVVRGRATGRSQRVCVGGVVTWTPGDVTVATAKGGLVSVVSTREYRNQMPQVIIGVDPWLRRHRAEVEGMLAAMFEGADQLRSDPGALAQAGAISAEVYGEQDGAYWAKYFRGTVETDRRGLRVELGGSRVNNLADDLELFGVEALAPGSANAFAATYKVFGDIVAAQYPDLVPGFPAAEEVVDTSYLVAVAHELGQVSPPSRPEFRAGGASAAADMVSRGAWDIAFEPGSARFDPRAEATLEALFQQLLVAGGTYAEIHGHTDATGDRQRNAALSEARAFAVKTWLERRSPAAFPAHRLQVFAHGQENPIAPNATAEGRARNRRVEIVLRSADPVALVAR